MRTLLTICSLLSCAALLCAQAPRRMNPNYDRDNPNRAKEEQKRPVTFKDRVSARDYPLSNKRVKQINDIVKGFLDRNENFNDEAVLDTLYEQVGNVVVMTPEKPADVRNFEELQKVIAPQVDKKYPQDAKQVRAAAEKEAEQKFAMQKPKDQVKVFYQRGNRTFAVSGTFYGYGYGGGSIQVNERHIAMFDLLPESRIRFDKIFNQKTREDFINGKVENYTAKKFAYSNSLLRKLQAEQRAANEKLGYIYADRKWNTAKKLTDDAVERAKAEAARRAEEARLKAEEERSRNMPPGQQPPDGMQQPMNNGYPRNLDQQQYY